MKILDSRAEGNAEFTYLKIISISVKHSLLAVV